MMAPFRAFFKLIGVDISGTHAGRTGGYLASHVADMAYKPMMQGGAPLADLASDPLMLSGLAGMQGSGQAFGVNRHRFDDPRHIGELEINGAHILGLQLLPGGFRVQGDGIRHDQTLSLAGP